MSSRKSTTNRNSLPRSTTAVTSVLAGVAAYFATEAGSGMMAEVLVFVLVAAAGTLIPSLRLTDPVTRERLSTDSTISSVILSLSSALAAAIASGQLPLPDSARGLIVALLASLTGTHVPSVLGTALGKSRVRPVAADDQGRL